MNERQTGRCTVPAFFFARLDGMRGSLVEPRPVVPILVSIGSTSAELGGLGQSTIGTVELAGGGRPDLMTVRNPQRS